MYVTHTKQGNTMTEKEIATLGIEDKIVRDFHVDPKYSPIQGRLLHISKGYLIPIDEPLYVLRGNDPVAPYMAQWYFDALVDEEQSEIVVGHQVTSNERVQTFQKYQAEHPEMVGRLYPKKGCECIIEPVSNDIGTDKDPEQDPEYYFHDFKLFHRYLNFYVPIDEPVMVFRGKDAMLIRVMQKHNELVEAQRGRYGDATADMLIHFNVQRIQKAFEFHRDHPERVGVTCSIFQKPTGQAYKEAMQELEEFGRSDKIDALIEEVDEDA